jgi:hypothetical protein
MSVNGYDIDAIVAKLQTAVDARYRCSGAVRNITGTGREYGPMVTLINGLKHGRINAAICARTHAENFSEASVSGQADRAEAIAAILDRTTHEDDDVRRWMPDHPAEVARAATGLHEYARAARAALAKGASPEPDEL